MKCYRCGSEETVLYGFGDYPNATWRCRQCGTKKGVPFVICAVAIIGLAYVLACIITGK